MTTLAFDTLRYVENLQKADISPKQAKAHVETLKEVINDSLATKADIEALRRETKNDNLAVKADIERVHQGLRLDIETLRQETKADRVLIRQEIEKLRQGTKTDIERLRQETKANINELGLKMTIKLGGLIGLAVIILATIIKF